MGFFDRFKRTNRPSHSISQRVGQPLARPGAPKDQQRPPVPAPRSAARPGVPGPAPGGLFSQPRFVVVDIETTGLSARSHRIIEIALVTADPWGRVLEEWTTRLNPQAPVGATHIHGITAADIAHAPTFDQVVGQLNLRLAGAAVSAHNARFDLAFLRAEYARAGWQLPHIPALCTLEASIHHLPYLERRRLADCCWAVGQPLVNAHSALGDARASAALLAAFMHPHIGMPPRPQDLELIRAAHSILWPSAKSDRAVDVPPTGATERSPQLSARARRKIAAADAPSSKSLIELVERFSLVDALDEGAPAGALAYLEKLAEVLEDGFLTAAEAADLAEVAFIEDLSAEDLVVTNRAFVLALAHEALSDGKITRVEKTEVISVADLLAVDAKVVPALLDKAEAARNARLGANLQPLPDGWTHGAALRVGDKVVFTGCDPSVREGLETDSEQFGVRTMNSVSAKTALLVTDGTMDGTKLAKARELGIRVVHPDDYTILLKHLQPAQAAPRRPAVRPGAEPDVAYGFDRHRRCPEEAPTAMTSTLLAPAPAVVRAWARQNGWEVGVRGRLPQPLLDAYAAAQSAAPTDISSASDPATDPATDSARGVTAAGQV